MDKKEIWKMALVSGICDADLSDDIQRVTDYGDATEEIESFAALIEESVREDCAKACDEVALLMRRGGSNHEAAAFEVAADEIRGRSND